MNFLTGEANSSVHGVITTEGIFEGKIITPDQTYIMERSKHFFKTPQPYHSVIYKQTDITMDLNSILCKSDELHQNLKNQQRKSNQYNARNQMFNSNKKDRFTKYTRLKREIKSENEILKKTETEKDYAYVQKRVVFKNNPAKTTCTVYVQADHLFYQHFASNQETVIEQLTQHVQGVNLIYKPVGECF